MENFRVTKAEENQKVYYFLKNHGYSERNISKLRQVGRLKINGQNANMRSVLKEDDILQVEQPESHKTSIAECAGTLEILYEDEDYLIVNKPALLACTPTRSHYTENLGGQICKYMKKQNNFVLRILNRLDRETSGIVVVAKNSLACKTKITKVYHALCESELSSPTTIDAPILTVVTEDGINQRKRIISPKGKSAITHITPLKTITQCKESKTSKSKITLISAEIETGRTHQIRVHMASISHPLVNDTIYSGSDSSKQDQNNIGIQNNTNQTMFGEKFNSKGKHAMLILKKITFQHFRTNQEISLEVDYPSDWHEFF